MSLLPDGPDHWSLRNVFAPFTSVVLGPGYWYGERTIRVETTPPDALVELFYVRAGFQKRFEQVEAPVTVVLPKRIEANPKDVVIVRAYVEGYRIRETTVKVSSRTDEVLLEMEPLPNVLESVAHTYFAGRAALTFFTKEALSLRVQQRDGGFAAALNQTARGAGVEEALSGIRGPLVEGLRAHQLGEDLLVEARWGPEASYGAPELRTRQAHDPLRDVYQYELEIVGARWGSQSIERTQAALARIDSSDVTGCAAEFDRALRAALDPAALSRALAPQGRFTDAYLRAAVKRLGEVSPGGVIELEDGRRYRGHFALELAAAHNDAASAKGYLALLRRLVALLELEDQRSGVLGGLVAPELPASAFAGILAGAEGRERACRNSG